MKITVKIKERENEMRKSFLRAVGVFTAALILCLGALPAYATRETYADRSIMEGDVIYFDNSVTQFDSVRIHIWANFGTAHNNDLYDTWGERPNMTNIGNNIWKFVVPSMEEVCAAARPEIASCADNYSYEQGYYKNLLFSDSKDTGGRQTINLPFVSGDTTGNTPGGIIYKATNSDGTEIEYYSKDKLKLLEKLNEGKEYADKIKCVEDEEVNRFNDVIDGLRLSVDETTRIVAEYSQTTVGYDYKVDTDGINSLDSLITETIANIKEKYGEEPTVCVEDTTDDESDNPDTFDTIGLFAGLGVASFAGLAIALNRKRRA